MGDDDTASSQMIDAVFYVVQRLAVVMQTIDKGDIDRVSIEQIGVPNEEVVARHRVVLDFPVQHPGGCDPRAG